METLPNGAVRVTNRAGPQWTEGPGWTITPEIAIGVAEGAPEEMFASISALAVGRDGRIYVLDRGTNELRIFSGEGSFLAAAGREGRGPGEFTAANGLLWLAGDSLVVVDQQGGRYSVLDADGRFVRSVPRHLGFYGWRFSGGVYWGRVYEESEIGDDASPSPVLIGTPVQPDQAPDWTRRDTIALPRAADGADSYFVVTTERGGMSIDIPFAADPLHHLARDGTVWHGHGTEFRLLQTTMRGDTLREILLDAPPAPVTDDEIARWEQSRPVREFRALGGTPDMGRIPETRAFFETLYVSPSGEIWTAVPAERREDTALAVFDGGGRFLGRITLPGVRLDRNVPIVVAGDRLYLVGRDELDLRRVHVFRIDRDPRAPEAS